ncbi:LOW QUALITY PROTEIN: 1-phosphatidylinositol 3-phosphate 5-kinase [Osmia bicornis bicornis]|uniref:LOW QUALITY PROTEIN: 1-phosphatidylinositol 3-phosphate 5-kinase n=1 Tax=Osmia bicornis bicornis TaxID=1437191 RepID=UPI001EAF68E8|nr:LOW QUALITY PROTEIN: 1-phosphatidylinositol 3-phosphate 5-kinase [Osmia bicornis bicornis]
MNKNMNSPSKLTEFAPLSPEESQPVVASLFSKFFSFTRSSQNVDDSTISSTNEEQSSSDSESWKQSESTEKTPEDDSSSMMNFPLDTREGRSLPNVLKRISNIVALKSNNLRSYKDSQLRSYWMPDNVSKQCYECGERFTTFRRRHHCRVCGQIFCSKCCCDQIPGKIMGCTGDLRVCTYCCKVVLSYLQSSDMRSDLSADLKALQEDLQVKYGSDSPPITQKNANESVEDDTSICRKPSVGYMEEKYAIGRSATSYLTSQERSIALQNSASLRMIYEELFRSSQAILLQTHRIRLKSYHNCFLANELVNWMIAQNKAATRVQATAIGQALLEAGFIEPVVTDNVFSDTATVFKPVKLQHIQTMDLLTETQNTCDAQEPAWVKTIPQHDSTTDSESETKPSNSMQQGTGRLPSSSSSFYLDLNLEASTVTLKRPTSEDLTTISVNSSDGVIEQKEITVKSHKCNLKIADDLLNDTLQVQEFKEKGGWHKATNLRTVFGELHAYECLTSAYKQHEDSLIKQLLNKEGLSQSWSEVILPIAHQIIDHVRPDLNHNVDDLDIRQYVQIKKCPGGGRDDCEIVSGVVCTKNVAHRGMNAMIAHPKILLLQCGLMYQRVEGKLLSLEPVMLQENEYLGHTVARITALGPDVVLVHRSVSRLAQDRLRECGVTLVLNVKLSVLERVARCTGANIVNTIDAHISARYMLGTCKKFYLRNFSSEKNGIKTLMYFEGCANPHLGATILLRGGSQPELKKVKNVTSTMIFAAYSWRLEKSFLMDEFARPPSPKDNSFLDETLNKDTEDFEKINKIVHTKSNEVNDSSSTHKEYTDSTEILKVTKIQEDSENISNGKQSIEIEISGNENVPVKDTVSDQTCTENILNSNSVKQISSILSEDADPYDTLKLFKPKTKTSVICTKSTEDNVASNASINNDGPNNTTGLGIDSSEDPNSTIELFGSKANEKNKNAKEEFERLRIKDKASSEEKRIYGESICDHSDPLHQYLNEGDEDVFSQTSPNGQHLSVADLPLLNKFKKALEGTILSVSPYLKFSVPYLETETGRNCVLRSFFPREIFYSVQFVDKVKEIKATNMSIESRIENPLLKLKLKPQHPFVQARLTTDVDSQEVQALLANFRACGSRLYPTNNVLSDKQQIIMQSEINDQTPVWPDCLDPASHQRLSVLFCSFSHTGNDTPAFCVNPWVVNMDLYGRNDIALGRFLERYCLTSEYKCPAQACRAQIAQHVRRFAHDGGCIHISLSEMSTEPFSQENANQILMWSKCMKCKSVSPVVPMSDDTWSLSFAKYLELRFHGSAYTRRGTDSCQHSLHHDHYQYFTKKNMLAVFKYTRISQWEISLPPPLINIVYDPKQHADVIEEMKSIALKGDEVFSSIREKLLTLQIDADNLNAVKQQLTKDQQYFKNKIEEIQLKLTSPTLENKKLEGKVSEKQVQALMFRIEDGIVILKRLISEVVFNWNAKILEMSVKKKDERPRRFTERSLTAGSNSIIDTDGYITEDTASESQLEDLSPMSADYNAIDAIAAAQHDLQGIEGLESSDNEVLESNIPEEIVVQGSPKMHQRSHSDVLPVALDDVPDKKKKKKTILSQLLPSVSVAQPIANPLGNLEHHLLPLGSVVPIVVYESEPSSIIAYALDSHDYKHALHELMRSTKGPDLNPSPLIKRKFPDNKENFTDITQSGEFKRPSVLSFFRGNSPNSATPIDSDKSVSTVDSNMPNPSTVAEIDEDKKTAKQQNYIEVQFNDATTNFYCRIYFAAQFAAFRENVLPCGEDGFTRSMSRSVQWAARGGKSGSTFCKSRDDRFIIKEMSRLEMQIFLDFAPNYFSYMEKCQQTKQPTLLGKIVGVYRVSFKNNTTNAALRTSVLVMENLFYKRTITDKFDLKGSVRNRLVNPEDTCHEGELVLLDENLLNMSCDSPLYIRSHSKAVLNRAIEQDTKFLADNSVMDYSLLVGLEPNSDELVLGIIDYIRTFTWDKKLETMVKKSGILGGQGKLPTIISPEEYRARFIAAMHRYFLPVPDRWSGLGRGVETS